MLIESLVGEVIGALVLLARYLLDRDIREQVQKLFRARVQLLQPRFLDPVASVHLLDDQLGIEADLELVRLPRLDRFETVDEGVVLGFVVGHHPQPAVHGPQLHAVLVLDDDARGGGSWIAARGAIGAEAQELRQRATRMRPQFSHCTSASPLRRICMPDDVTVTWHAAHSVPLTRAIGGRTRMRPLISSFSLERRRERWSSRAASDSRRRPATSSCWARAAASASSRWTMAGSDSSLASVAEMDSRSVRSRSTSA